MLENGPMLYYRTIESLGVAYPWRTSEGLEQQGPHVPLPFRQIVENWCFVKSIGGAESLNEVVSQVCFC